jgi:hypothetical protein
MKRGFTLFCIPFCFLLALLLQVSCLKAQDIQLAFAKGISSTPFPIGGNIRGNGIKTDALGNVYVVGTFAQTADFDPGAGVANLTSAGGDDIFLAKYDANGNYVYAKRMGGTNADVGNSIAIDASGHAFITGTFSGIVDFDPDAGIQNLSSAGGSDIFFARYDASGNYVYAKCIAGTGAFDQGLSIAVDASGHVFLTGLFFSVMDFDPDAGIQNLSSAGSTDIFLAKYDANGNYVYAKR